MIKNICFDIIERLKVILEDELNKCNKKVADNDLVYQKVKEHESEIIALNRYVIESMYTEDKTSQCNRPNREIKQVNRLALDYTDFITNETYDVIKWNNELGKKYSELLFTYQEYIKEQLKASADDTLEQMEILEAYGLAIGYKILPASKEMLCDILGVNDLGFKTSLKQKE